MKDFWSSSRQPGETLEEYQDRKKALEDIQKFQDVYRRSVDGHNCQLSDTKQEGRIFGNVAQPFVVAKIFKGLASIVQLRRGPQAAELAVSLEEAAAAAQEGKTLLQTGQTARTAATGAKVAHTAAQEGEALLQTGQTARTAATGAAKTGQTARTAAAGEQLGETFAAAQRGRNIAGAGVMSEEVAAEALQAEEAACRAANLANAAKTEQAASEVVAGSEGGTVVAREALSKNSFKTVSKDFLSKCGIKNIHQFKRDFLGKNVDVSLFDIVKHTQSGELLIVRKTSQKIVEYTGIFI